VKKALLFACLISLFSCQTPPARVPWETESTVEISGFIVLPEPTLRPPDYENYIHAMAIARDQMAKAFFPEYSGQKIGIVLYSTSFSYEKHRIIDLPTLADYERYRNRINIPLGAQAEVWNHELSHALLEIARPGSVYWMHEGIAIFLQNHSMKKECDSMASLPTELHIFLPDIRRLSLAIPSSVWDYHIGAKESMISAALSAYFMLYLWKERKFTQFLESYQHSQSAPDFLLSGGNQEEWRKICARFTEWLKTAEPLGRVPGC